MKKSEVLYHYCSTESFYKIISERQIKLSSLSLTNDSLEGRLVRETIEKLCNKSKLGTYQTNDIRYLINAFEQILDSYGFCLTEVGDLLSQWIMYADDANGISIGFSTEYLKKLLKNNNKENIDLCRILYEEDEHIETLTPIFEQVRKVLGDPKIYPRALNTLSSMLSSESNRKEMEEKREKEIDEKLSKLRTVMLKLVPQMFTLKTKDWEAECEWRLLQSGVIRDEVSCKHMPKKSSIVPHDFLELKSIDGLEPILKIISGSKHLTPKLDLLGFLRNHKFNVDDDSITKSILQYR